MEGGPLKSVKIKLDKLPLPHLLPQYKAGVKSYLVSVLIKIVQNMIDFQKEMKTFQNINRYNTSLYFLRNWCILFFIEESISSYRLRKKNPKKGKLEKAEKSKK